MHSLKVSRTARYATLGADPRSAAEIWLVCHGYGQLASRFVRKFSPVLDGKRLIIAPEALSRFYLSGSDGPHTAEDRVGASWMTREDRDAEVTDQVSYIDAVVEAVTGAGRRSRARFVALGFSQGAAVACRWAVRGAVAPDELVVWASAVPADVLGADSLARLAHTTVTLVTGDADPVMGSGEVEEQQRILRSAGVSCRFIGFKGGHEMHAGTLNRLAARGT